MGKIILAREQDHGKKEGGRFALLVGSLTMGVAAGACVSAIVCPLMQRLLNSSSALVVYGFNLGPVFLLVAVIYFYMKKDYCGQNHAKCKMCRRNMRPLTEGDMLFSLPLNGDGKYDDALHYLAGNMNRISGMNGLGDGQRCCYVCVYQCDKCFKRIIRVKDFLPVWGVCEDRGTYYFDYAEFMDARGKEL